MKKIVSLLLISILFVACGAIKTVEMSRLQIGMSKAQVQELIGYPERVLYAGASEGGYEEVVEYRTYRDELYAVTYWNDHLESYEFIRDTYVPPVTVTPPVYPTPRPPVYPSPTPRPPVKPTPIPPRPPITNPGPGTGGGNEGSNGGSNRPKPGDGNNGGGSNRPKPGDGNNGSTTQPTTRPSTGETTARPIERSTSNQTTSRPAERLNNGESIARPTTPANTNVKEAQTGTSIIRGERNTETKR